MRVRPLVVPSLVAAFWLLGCASMLGIDQDYTLEPSPSSGGRPGSGGRSSGGARASGGSADGGARASGGSADGGALAMGGSGDGGAEAMGGGGGAGNAGGECASGQKLCEDVTGVERCFRPDPAVGCDLTGCEQCPFPERGGGHPTCEGTVCGISCDKGYVQSGNTCTRVSVPDGGNIGTGGRPSSCKNDDECPFCGNVRGCCSIIPAGICGCNFVWCVPPPPQLP